MNSERRLDSIQDFLLNTNLQSQGGARRQVPLLRSMMQPVKRNKVEDEEIMEQVERRASEQYGRGEGDSQIDSEKIMYLHSELSRRELATDQQVFAKRSGAARLSQRAGSQSQVPKK